MLAPYVGLLSQVEDQVVECFRTDGGVPYAAFPRFTAIMVGGVLLMGVRHTPKKIP